MIRLPSAKIENAVDPNHERIADVYFDRENSRLIATDGIGMVVIPVEPADEDVGGRIPVWAIKVARTMGGRLGLHCEDKLTIKSDRHGTVHGKRPTLDFPSIDRVMSQIDAGEERATISLSANRLLELAEALLDDNPLWGDYGVTLHIRGEKEPILVKPHVGRHSGHGDDGRFGVLMPLEPKGE